MYRYITFYSSSKQRLRTALQSGSEKTQLCDMITEVFSDDNPKLCGKKSNLLLFHHDKEKHDLNFTELPQKCSSYFFNTLCAYLYEPIVPCFKVTKIHPLF